MFVLFWLGLLSISSGAYNEWTTKTETMHKKYKNKKYKKEKGGEGQ